jgi:hypothetical protein
VRELARPILIASNFVVLALPAALGSGAGAYLAATALLVGVNAALVCSQVRRQQVRLKADTTSRLSKGSPRAIQGHILTTAAIATAVTVLVVVAAYRWLHEILIYPIDAQRADMLVVIQNGLRRMLQGRNPYTIYYVPWDAPLPYGPMLWAPFFAPHALHVDLRFLSILGALFVPIACAFAAAAAAADRRPLAALGWIGVLAAIASSPNLRQFMSIAHTPVYWPLLAAFAWLVVRERWVAAAVAAGLLIVARSTMVSLAPVLAIAVWHRDRRRLGPVLLAVGSTVVVAYAPFAIADWRALAYALYGSYQHVMKDFVWTSTDWATRTVGITGLLLRAGWTRAVEPVQGVAMLATYAAAWRALRRGAGRSMFGTDAASWMAAALLVFSMTTLWPVDYIYFDVFLLWAAAAAAIEFSVAPVGRVWTACAGASVAALAMVAFVAIPRDATVDVGLQADRPALYAGFSADEAVPDRTFAWVDGARADVLLPRRSRRGADIEVVCQPYLPSRDATQEMHAALNGTVIGSVHLRPGWQTVRLFAPPQAWQIGVNRLTLSLSTATSPRDVGEGEDSRRLSVAVDRLTVRSQ